MGSEVPNGVDEVAFDNKARPVMEADLYGGCGEV